MDIRAGTDHASPIPGRTWVCFSGAIGAEPSRGRESSARSRALVDDLADSRRRFGAFRIDAG